MSEDREISEQGGRRGWVRWWPRVAPMIVVIAVVGWLGVERARTTVSWPAVVEAAGEKTTIHGLARVHPKDGSVWEYALWARVEGPGTYTTEGMLRPVRSASAERRPSPAPGAELRALCAAMDYFGENGIVSRVAAGPEKQVRARWARVSGDRALLVELEGAAVAGEKAEYVDRWQVYVDAETMLVRRVELVAIDGGERLVRGRCDYRYDEPLPPGFGGRQE